MHTNMILESTKDDVKENKKLLRQRMISMRDELDTMWKKEYDATQAKAFLASRFFRDAESLMFNVSFGSEFNTIPLIQEALKLGKTVCVPKVHSKALGIIAFQINSINELMPGYNGILEPMKGAKLMSVLDVDTVVVPGLAFDTSGYRLGYGGGFYDKFLSMYCLNKVSFAYPFQILNKIPKEEHDIKILKVFAKPE